jgi:zinc D-Ala-D-Ala carboxypeptidase
MLVGRKTILVCVCLAIAAGFLRVSPAWAYEFSSSLRSGDSGGDVRRLQVRIAGWYSIGDRHYFPIDGDFGPATEGAVKAFEAFHDLKVDGVAGSEVFEILGRLEDKNGSTHHFDFSEFTQNYNPMCGAKANAYEGTFNGGMVAPARVKRHVRRLMWRLEALRAKAGAHPVGINSGFRSAAYNNCIGGASSSQHMYGTAADNRVAETTNRRARSLAKHSQVHGIGCYARLSHNHFDLRMDNKDLPSTRAFWWPKRNKRGNDLDSSGRPCWGEGGSRTATKGFSFSAVLAAVGDAVAGAGSLVPSVAEIHAFESAGEPSELVGAD